MKENTMLENIAEALGEIGMTLFALVLLTGFVICLFAPALGNLLTDKISKKIYYAKTNEDRANLRAQIVLIKTMLWLIAIIAWSILAIVNIKFFI